MDEIFCMCRFPQPRTGNETSTGPLFAASVVLRSDGRVLTYDGMRWREFVRIDAVTPEIVELQKQKWRSMGFREVLP